MPDELRDLLLNEHVRKLWPVCVGEDISGWMPAILHPNTDEPMCDTEDDAANLIVYAVEDALMVNGFTLGCDQETPQSFDVYQGRGPVYVRESSRPLAALRAWARLSEGG